MPSAPHPQPTLTDDHLIQHLPGFRNARVQAGKTALHCVIGGEGAPLVLLPGWPQTWWAFRKILPLLARHYQVIAVDLRGMGSSDKPAGGYDKKTLAADIYALVQQLGHAAVHVAGHDIGAGVAYSYAASHPEATRKLILLDTPPVDAAIYRLPMLPAPGGVAERAGAEGAVYPWWLAFNQLRGLPEALLTGRGRTLIDWLFDYLLVDPRSVDETARKVYAQAYDQPESIRAMNAWYQAFPQDIADNAAYGRLGVPVAGIGGSGYPLLQQALPGLAGAAELHRIENGGHFLAEEKPAETAACIRQFLG